MPICLPSFAGVAQPASGGGFANQYSLSLDGTNDYLEIPQGTFNLGSGVFSFSLWFNANSLNAYNTFFNISSNNTLKLAGFVTSGGDIYCSNWNWDNIIASGNTINTGTWYHVAFVKSTAGNSGVFKLYLNGNLLTTSPTNGIMGQGSTFGGEDSTSTIGKTYSAVAPYPFDGKIDEFAFWNSALSASDITDIYNSGVPNDIGTNGLNLNPVGWWRMGDNDGGTGNIVTDQGVDSQGNPSGNNGTLKNIASPNGFVTDVPS